MKFKGCDLLKDINKLDLGTIIESSEGERYILKEDKINNVRTFSRVNKKDTRFCTYPMLQKEYEISKKENKKIEEYKTNYTERCIDVEVRNKLNEVIRAVNKLNEQIKNNKDTNYMTD